MTRYAAPLPPDLQPYAALPPAMFAYVESVFQYAFFVQLDGP